MAAGGSGSWSTNAPSSGNAKNQLGRGTNAEVERLAERRQIAVRACAIAGASGQNIDWVVRPRRRGPPARPARQRALASGGVLPQGPWLMLRPAANAILLGLFLQHARLVGEHCRRTAGVARARGGALLRGEEEALQQGRDGDADRRSAAARGYRHRGRRGRRVYVLPE